MAVSPFTGEAVWHGTVGNFYIKRGTEHGTPVYIRQLGQWKNDIYV
jgi:hypothetical protein